jgi:2-polyprenyl-3-methyl-5-hydroxy-6-metoxy-1,4-benzoquinol methylase
MLQAALRLYTGDGPARLLDVGCGVGRFLLEAKSVGMAVVGCDLSPEACKFINDQLQISAHHAELHKCSSEIGMVDVVVMNDFIEHPTHPLSAIEAAVSILRPGGLLLVHTPNGGEAGKNPEIAKNWVGFRVDLEHLQYLSPHTVNWLAKKYGLMVERLETSGFPNLNALGGSPIQSSRVTSWIKQVVKKIPGSTPTVRLAQSLRTGMTGSNNDPRLGSYHLYAILRKL